MANKIATMNETADREIVFSRLLNAPRELVWKAWTDPKQVAVWWGPDGFTNTIHEMDVKPGGVWKFIMHGPDGRDYPNQVIFVEVEKPSRLVYTHGSGIEDGFEDFHVEVFFEDRGDKTELTMRSIFKSAAGLQKVVKEHGAIEGAKQHLGRLEKFLADR